jgi:hypothetical protein
MDAPEPEQTPFAAVTAQTSKFSRVSRRNIHSAQVCGLINTHSRPQIYQSYLDKSTPFVTYRWASTIILLIAFFLRIVVAEGWYIGTKTPAPHQISLNSQSPRSTRVPRNK